jgi:hypothetical protein
MVIVSPMSAKLGNRRRLGAPETSSARDRLTIFAPCMLARGTGRWVHSLSAAAQIGILRIGMSLRRHIRLVLTWAYTPKE